MGHYDPHDYCLEEIMLKLIFLRELHLNGLFPLVITSGIIKFKNQTFIGPTSLNGCRVLKIDTEIMMPVQSA